MNRFLFLPLSLMAGMVAAQHQHHEGMSMPMNDKPKADTTKPMDHSMHSGMDMGKHKGTSMPGESTPGMNMDGSMADMKMPNYGLTMDTTMGMTHSLSRNLPMNRNGSGTSWHPDNTPMYAYMGQPSGSKWSYMLHYAVYLRYTNQNVNNAGKRGQGINSVRPTGLWAWRSVK